MNLTVAVQGIGGHTEMLFEDGRVKLTWKETSMRERSLLRDMIKTAKEKGATIHEVDENGCAGKETTKVPGTIFNRKGELIIKGSGQLVQVLAKCLVEAEVKNSGRLVMEEEKGQWRILRVGDFELKKEEKKEPAEKEAPRRVVSSTRAAGG